VPKKFGNLGHNISCALWRVRYAEPIHL